MRYLSILTAALIVTIVGCDELELIPPNVDDVAVEEVAEQPEAEARCVTMQREVTVVHEDGTRIVKPEGVCFWTDSGDSEIVDASGPLYRRVRVVDQCGEVVTDERTQPESFGSPIPGGGVIRGSGGVVGGSGAGGGAGGGGAGLLAAGGIAAAVAAGSGGDDGAIAPIRSSTDLFEITLENGEVLRFELPDGTTFSIEDEPASPAIP